MGFEDWMTATHVFDAIAQTQGRCGGKTAITFGLTNHDVSFQINPGAGNCRPDVLTSPHNGAMLVGLGDGSVRNVAPGISTATWLAVCNPQSQNVPGSDW